MASLSVVEAKLPPGFRFHPRDDELVCEYLLKKANNSRDSSLLIEVDLNKCEPWDIPDIACVGGKEWYFYSQRDRKYATGLRTNRATVSGYWKATGKDRLIFRKCNLVGMRKTLVFYQGRAPKGKKTDWVMHEFRLEGPLGPPKISSSKEDWVLCRVFYKNVEVEAAKPSSMASSTTNANSAPTSTCYDETGSSPLPALMDSYITFDQTPSHDNMNTYDHEQVPCFSILSPTPNFSQIFHHMEIMQQPNMPSKNPTTTTTTITATDPPAFFNGNGIGNLSPLLPCDAHVIKAVLCHLSKTITAESSPSPNMEGGGSGGGGGGGGGGSTSFIGGEEASSESYSSHDVGLPTSTMWSHY
ncbi:hypothetical protein Ancab_025732 [Ancistrocladus abbreviatus]